MTLGAGLGQPVRAVEPTQDFSKLVITELFYNPQATNGVDGDAFEFIELQNTGGTALDLGGVSFTGISGTLTTPTWLGAGQFLVLVRDPVHFAERFPAVPFAAGYFGKLDNGGETINVLDPTGAIITSVTYDDHAPWPTQADHPGLSLQRVNSSPDVNNPANWTAAKPTPGAPLPAELVDTDTDHIPDIWETQHGLDMFDPTDAARDTDGDGLTNLSEYWAGTDPKDPADCLKFLSARIEQTPSYRIIELSFKAAANRSYSLFWQQDDCWRTEDVFEARSTNRIETVRHAIHTGAPVIFYHLATPSQLPPPCDGDSD
jgi:hypothetical protein